jgi:hypothetical protein
MKTKRIPELCSCGGIIKLYEMCGVSNPKFDPYFKECQKCFRMFVRTDVGIWMEKDKRTGKLKIKYESII